MQRLDGGSTDAVSSIETGRTRTVGDDAAEPATPIVFSTENINPKEQFESWRETFGSLHDVEVEADRRQAFSASGQHWMLGPILFGVYETPARRIIRSSKRCAQDDIDHWYFRVSRVGRIVSRSGDDIIEAGPGELNFSTFGRPYEEDQVAGEWIAAMIPRGSLPLLSSSPPAPGVLRGAPARLLADFLLSLAERLKEASKADLPSIAEATRGMIAACVRPTEVPQQMEQVFLRERIDRIIFGNIASARLDANRLCELSCISRSSLYRVFESRGGVARHLHRLRLKLVHRDLTDPALANQPIARLAELRGLHNASSFNRAFRREFGCTPGDVRAAMQSNIPLLRLYGEQKGGSNRFHFIDLLRGAP